MFNKKTCSKCGKKSNNKNSFCPSCGSPFKEDNKNWGMLGKNDIPTTNEFESLFGGISGKMISKMLGSTMKMLEKEMRKEFQNPPQTKTNFELIINGERINPKNIKVTTKPMIVQKQNKKEKILTLPQINSSKLTKFKNIKKTEPSTNIRRLDNKLIYEINIPGVKSIEDVSLNQLENSIEFKALAKNKVYSKLIPLNLRILNYILENEKLILELESK